MPDYYGRSSRRLRHPVRSVRRWWRHRPPRDNGLALVSVGIVLVAVAVVIVALT